MRDKDKLYNDNYIRSFIYKTEFSSKTLKEFKEICPNAKTIIIDGELFSWYGSRLKYTADYLMKLKDHISII